MKSQEEIIQGVMDELDNVRHGKNKPWIFDENGKVSEDVFVFDVMKLLEAFKNSDDIILNVVPFDVEDVRKEAEEAKEMLESITSVGKLIAFINKDNRGLIDLDSIMVEWEGEYVDLDYVGLELEEMPENTKVVKVGFDEYGEYVDRPTISREELNGTLFKGDTFEFGVFDDNGDTVLEATNLDSLEGDLNGVYVLSTDEIYEIAEKKDNTYNYDCNISNDIDWCEADTDAYGKIAMMKFHIAGDIRGNYTDEIFLKLGDCDGLMEYLHMQDEYSNIITDHATVEVDGKEYSIDICPFTAGVEVYNTETWDNVCTCYDVEKSAVEAEIRKETTPMQSMDKGDVKKEGVQAKTNITKE